MQDRGPQSEARDAWRLPGAGGREESPVAAECCPSASLTDLLTGTAASSRLQHIFSPPVLPAQTNSAAPIGQGCLIPTPHHMLVSSSTVSPNMSLPAKRL